MKKLLTYTSLSDPFRLIKGAAVYGRFKWSENKWHYFDLAGNPLPAYTPPPVDPAEREPYEEPAIHDRLLHCYLNHGFYAYTSHPVQHDPDGAYGRFGIKTCDGRTVTEEIFFGIDSYEHGLCPVRGENDLWGCVDTEGKLVVPYLFFDPPRFNKYGVAEGNSTLIDLDGNPIADTELDNVEDCWCFSRYYVFGSLTEQQQADIDRCGSAENILVDIYDTKTRSYILRSIPEDALYVSGFDGEPEVILAAAKLLGSYDSVSVEDPGYIHAEKGDSCTVFDFYAE